ncbi:MAG TPA: HAMP domain-containing sensor histidine kinase [Feifaniaceae bacterium]|nr:HAMP domain-containing sensor histidine kinase [Feifaniaceae bacterium]
MKKQTLGMRLSRSYAMMALILVAAVSLFTNLFLRDAFVQYVMREQEARNQSVVEDLQRQYKNGGFSVSSLETLGMRALEQGMILRVKDAQGRTLWNAMTHNNGLCNQMLMSMAESMQSRYPNFQGAYEEKEYPLAAESANAGSVAIGYYGPYFFTDSDTLFIDTLNRALVVIGLLSLLLAGILGFFMARRLSRPISQATHAAKRIAGGNYQQIEVRADTRELNDLVQSLNMLSGTLEEQEMLRRRLTQDVAHELRTPLTALQGNLEALIDGVWQPDQKRLESCHEEVTRLSRLVKELEKLARLESRTERLAVSKVDLFALANRAAANFGRAIEEKGLSVAVTGEPVVIEADEDKLFQVLVNLLSNSIKYTPAGRSVAVRTGLKPAGEAYVTVEDTGEGIAKKDLPYIFERFYRADASRSSRTGGIGVGLAIAKAIVELHHGGIEAKSEPGGGAMFTVTLPTEQGKDGEENDAE